MTNDKFYKAAASFRMSTGDVLNEDAIDFAIQMVNAALDEAAAQPALIAFGCQHDFVRKPFEILADKIRDLKIK